MTEDLLKLAERCEQATGPDRELDALIWCRQQGIKPKWVGVGGELLDAGPEGIIGWIDPGVSSRNFSTNRSSTGPGSIPAYSASLDAAMTLVPDGFGNPSDIIREALSALGKRLSLHIMFWPVATPYPECLARHITAAAIRARAAALQGEG